jgi:DNA primase
MMADGLDPDEYIQKNGTDKFRNEVIGASLTWMAFKFLYFRRGKIFNMKEISSHTSNR